MLKLLSASALSLLVAAPAWAIAPHCRAELASIKSSLAEEVAVPHGMAATYDKATRLCREGHEMQAQDLARDMKDRLARSSSHTASVGDASLGG